jgi:hypothetical protein
MNRRDHDDRQYRYADDSDRQIDGIKALNRIAGTADNQYREQEKALQAQIGSMSVRSTSAAIAGKTIVPILTRNSSHRPGFSARKS